MRLTIKGAMLLKDGLSPQPPKLSVVLCGEISPHRKLLTDSANQALRFTLVRCPEDRESAFSVCHKLEASVLIARQEFILQLTTKDLSRLSNHGRVHILAILGTDGLDASVKMLRLGCRGVLPPRFSSKCLRRAILAILDGELWAPRGAVSFLLSELLKCASSASSKDENLLTPQEQRIFELSSQGYKNSAIASALFISTETVRWHKRRLYRKIGKSGTHLFPQSQAAPRNPGLAAG
ncbi:MAG TPA: LuxR C-terminal-related transcriptional regulator [Bryobacteraceae bacterium]|nr:LuxR C-terminal-related transcriptional regulator [Bryobacteraceae bacterium]